MIMIVNNIHMKCIIIRVTPYAVSEPLQNGGVSPPWGAQAGVLPRLGAISDFDSDARRRR